VKKVLEHFPAKPQSRKDEKAAKLFSLKCLLAPFYYFLGVFALKIYQ
jgi:hypothetical protein